MELAARIGTMAQRGEPLPYMRRVAYLESHGTEWIDTGLVARFDNQFCAEVAFAPTAVNHGGTGTTTTVCITGANSSATSGFELRWQGSGWGGSYGNYASREYSDFTLLVGQELVAKNDNGHITYSRDGTLFIDLNANVLDKGFVGGSVILFGVRRGTSVQAITLLNGKVYEAKYSVAGVLMRDFIPVLDLSGRPCMYNQAPSSVPADDPSRFFYNEGTGEFTWGELDAASALSSSRGGGTKCLTPRHSYRRLARPSARFCARSISQRLEVAA